MEPLQLLKTDDSLELRCKVVGTPVIKISWSKDDRPIKESAKHRISFLNSEAVLLVKDCSVGDSGEYSCEAQNEAGTDSCSSIVTVKEPPSFSKKFDPVEVLRDTEVVLESQLLGTPPFDISWFKDNRPIRSSRKYKTIMEDALVKLNIIRFDSSDIGEYECRAYNEVGSCMCSSGVTLKEPPSFVRKIENLGSLIGGSVAFQCIVKGSQPISVVWLKDNEEVMEDDNIKAVFQNNVATLSISSVQAQNGGKFSCQAKNDAGTQRCSATLSVKEPATITEKPVSIDVTEGDPATLQCRFSGSKDITAKWLRGAKEITFGPKYKINTTDRASVLKILSTEKRDSGDYTFEVQNDVGRSSCSATISVLDLIIPPSFTKKLRKMDSVKGSFVHLECIVSGTHPITVKWQKDGQEIVSSEKHKYSFHENIAFLEINQLEAADSGSYTCAAANKAGSSQCSGYLTVKEPPYFVEEPLSQDAIPRVRVHFKALMGGTSPMVIKWFKDSKELLSGASRSVWKDESSSILELLSTKVADSGSYTCQATNDVGTVMCKVALFVKGGHIIPLSFFSIFLSFFQFMSQ
ncbi:titin-like [Lissotriton helveticus]